MCRGWSPLRSLRDPPPLPQVLELNEIHIIIDISTSQAGTDLRWSGVGFGGGVVREVRNVSCLGSTSVFIFICHVHHQYYKMISILKVAQWRDEGIATFETYSAKYLKDSLWKLFRIQVKRNSALLSMCNKRWIGTMMEVIYQTRGTVSSGHPRRELKTRRAVG